MLNGLTIGLVAVQFVPRTNNHHHGTTTFNHANFTIEARMSTLWIAQRHRSRCGCGSGKGVNQELLRVHQRCAQISL
jgi:hypothetical protein